ncbi:MAG: hypothetical protein UX21_C0020G0011 [Microgenomates group bacterium GW2011_GWC2_45_8]|nr:MAG: hypothetical protein UX21_C0020G0011 [Microgenomates group bacterium GW2011_GWC2_45_8]KKU25505.1 MAG: hypothetical protein UX37_C0020G0005 [Microgenomates group bacterium GW2011_GWA2_46_16]
MPQNAHASPVWVRNLFFWSGIIATVCYRAIVVLNHYSGKIALAAWYIGTVGFILYFWHRYAVSEKRVELIKQHDLINAVKQTNLSQPQIEANEYILTTLLSTKEKWNYIVIFVTSFLALIIGIYLDFFR